MADLDSHTAPTAWPDQPPGPAEADITTFTSVRHHITRSREKTRLWDDRAAGGADISTSNLEALRQARAETTLCPVYQSPEAPEWCFPGGYSETGTDGTS